MFQDEFTSESYLTVLPWYSCTSQEYSQLFGFSIFFGLFYCIGIPLLFAVLLFRSRNTQDSKWTQQTLEFFYSNYSLKYYYMEIVWILHNLLLTIGFSMFSDNIPVQGNCLFPINKLILFSNNYTINTVIVNDWL